MFRWRSDRIAMFDFYLELASLLSALDFELTGKNQPNPGKPESVWTDMYYLSDGGYSRIKYFELSGNLELLSEPLEKVKQNWDNPECIKLRTNIEYVCNRIISLEEP